MQGGPSHEQNVMSVQRVNYDKIEETYAHIFIPVKAGVLLGLQVKL